MRKEREKRLKEGRGKKDKERGIEMEDGVERRQLQNNKGVVS